MLTPLQRIHLADLFPSSAEPIRMLGRFDDADELTYCQAPDMELEWWRGPDESAEAFSRRIANDLLTARGRPPLPEPLPRVEEMIAHAAPPPVNMREEPRERRDSKLIEEGFKAQPPTA